MPRPRISSIPVSAGAGRTSKRPAQASTWARSSATSRVKGRALCSRSQTSCDLPEPAGPRISAALGPISTAEAWMVTVSAAITSPAAVPRSARARRALRGTAAGDVMAADTVTIHASAVLIGPKAALIRGPAGSGKSQLVWDLLQSALPFTRLVADDRAHVEALSLIHI